MGTCSNTDEHGAGLLWPAEAAGRSLHSAAVVAQHLALLAQVLGVLLALVGHVQAVGLLQGPLQRGSGKRAQGGETKGQQETQKHRVKQERGRGEEETGGARHTQREPRGSVRGHRGCCPRHQGPSCLSLSPEAQAGARAGARAVGEGPVPRARVWTPFSIPQHSLSSHRRKLTKTWDRGKTGAQTLSGYGNQGPEQGRAQPTPPDSRTQRFFPGCCRSVPPPVASGLKQSLTWSPSQLFRFEGMSPQFCEGSAAGALDLPLPRARHTICHVC